MGRGRIWRELGNGMRGYLGGGRPKNWRRQGKNFGPRSTPPPIKPKAEIRVQRGTLRRDRGIGN